MPTREELLRPVKVAILYDLVRDVKLLFPFSHQPSFEILCSAFVDFRSTGDTQTFRQRCAAAQLRLHWALSDIVILLHMLYDRSLAQLVLFYQTTEGYENVLSVRSTVCDWHGGAPSL